MIDTLSIREENVSDFDAIRIIVKEAFAKAEHSDGDEHNLVERLRGSAEYLPRLSLVAEADGVIAGYAMFSRISIGKSKSVALAPLAVHPDFQGYGIGRTLIYAGHTKAMDSGFSCSVVLGSPEYYSRFGYRTASAFGIRAPFDVESRYYMVFPFKEELPQGYVRYSSAFGL